MSTTKQQRKTKARYRETADGKLLYLPSTRTREYLRAQMMKRPEQFRAEIDRTGGTPKQEARRRYLKRLLLSLRPDVMRAWYGTPDGPAPVTTRRMTDEERARWLPDGQW